MDSIQIKKYSNFGSKEPWVARIQMGLSGFTNLLEVGISNEQLINNSIFYISEELGFAFTELLDLKTNIDYTELNLKKHYNDLYDHLWKAYKDRLPETAELLGFNDIGFIFSKEDRYQSQSKHFIDLNPNIGNKLSTMIMDERQTWQQELSNFRNNYLQHRKEGVQIDHFYKLQSAEIVFANVWQAIEDIIIILMSDKLMPQLTFREIPEEEREEGNPQRFVIVLK